MRIGLVCPYSVAVPGGVQNHVFGLARWLREQGHHVQVVAPGEPHHAADRAGFTSTGPAVPVRYNGSVARVSAAPQTGRRVRRWLSHGNFDVLHVHEPLTPLVSVTAWRQATMPVVATFHTATPGSRALAMAGRLWRNDVAQIAASIAVSGSAAATVTRYLGIEPVVIGNGIRIDDFCNPRSPGPYRGGKHPVLTFVGRYDEPRKGFGVLQAALPAILDRYPDAEVVVAGPGRPRRSTANVRFAGQLSDTQRNRLLGATDVFLAPHTGRESFGIVLLEALASGASVVASDLDAFADIVGRSAVPAAQLFAVGDAEALATATLAALRQRPDRAYGHELAGRYDWSVVGPLILEQYQVAARRV